MYIDPPPFYDARIPFNHPIFCPFSTISAEFTRKPRIWILTAVHISTSS